MKTPRIKKIILGFLVNSMLLSGVTLGSFLLSPEISVGSEHELNSQDFNSETLIKVRAYLRKGHNLYLSGHNEAAIEAYNKAIEIDPSWGQLYVNRGVSRELLGDYEGALVDYTEAIRLESTDASAYSNRGNCLHKLGEYEGASDDFTEVIRLEPNNAYGFYGRGLAYEKLGNTQQAIKDLEVALDLSRSQGDELLPYVILHTLQRLR